MVNFVIRCMWLSPGFLREGQGGEAVGAGVPSDVQQQPDGSAAEAQNSRQNRASAGSDEAPVDDGLRDKQTQNTASEDVHPLENEVMKELREEITNMGVDAETIEKYKENIQHAVGSKFTDILDEALQELRNEGVEADIDKEVAFRHMAASLASLLDGMGQKDQHSSAAAKKAQAQMPEDTAAVEPSGMSVPENMVGTETSREQVPATQETNESPEPAAREEAKTPATTKISIKRIRIEPKVEVKMVDIAGEVAGEGQEPIEDEPRSADATAETRSVRTVVAILQPAGREARKEEARQREMEGNYNRLWSRKPKTEL